MQCGGLANWGSIYPPDSGNQVRMNESAQWLVSGKVNPPERIPFYLDRRNVLEEIEQSN